MIDGDGTHREPMTAAEKAVAAEDIARMYREREALAEQRQKGMDEGSKAMKALDDQIEELVTAIQKGKAVDPQGDLFHEENVPPAEAPKLLTEIAKRAEGDGDPVVDGNARLARRGKAKGPLGRKREARA